MNQSRSVSPIKSAKIYCGGVCYPVKRMELSHGVLTCISPISMGTLLILLNSSDNHIEPRVMFNGDICKIYDSINSQFIDGKSIKVTFVANEPIDESGDSADES